MNIVNSFGGYINSIISYLHNFGKYVYELLTIYLHFVVKWRLQKNCKKRTSLACGG